MGLTEFIVRYATLVISKTGYIGIGVLMTMESMIMPVPSEAVMPFAGFLWFEHKLSFWGIVLAATTGSIIGSLLSYCIGAYGGRPFVKKYGKYFLLNEHHLDSTEQLKRGREEIIGKHLTVREAESLVKRLKSNRVRPPRKQLDPQMTDLVEQLKRHFKAKVALRQGSRGGKLEISYANLDDLTRIIDIITS